MWDLIQCQKFQSRGPVPPFRGVLRRLATRWNWWMGSACKWCWSTAQGLKISCGIANCSSYMYAHASAEGYEMILTGPQIVLPIFTVLATKNLLGTAQKTGSATSCHSLLCPAALLSNHEYGLIKRLECNCEFIGCSFVLNFFPSPLCLFEFPPLLCLHLGRCLWLARHLQFQTLDRWKPRSPLGGKHVRIPIHWWSIPLNGLKTSWKPVTNMLKQLYKTCPVGL